MSYLLTTPYLQQFKHFSTPCNSYTPNLCLFKLYLAHNYPILSYNLVRENVVSFSLEMNYGKTKSFTVLEILCKQCYCVIADIILSCWKKFVKLLRSYNFGKFLKNTLCQSLRQVRQRLWSCSLVKMDSTTNISLVFSNTLHQGRITMHDYLSYTGTSQLLLTCCEVNLLHCRDGCRNLLYLRWSSFQQQLMASSR